MRNEGGQAGMAGMAGQRGWPGKGRAPGHRGMLRRDSIVKLIRHELNTPLATALLYIGIAEGSAAALPEGVVHSALRVARAEVQRLKTLLDTVTELECVGYATPRPRSINVGETVRATVQRLVAVRDAATSSGGHARRPAGVVGSVDGRADRRQSALECPEVRSGTPDSNRRQTGGVWRSHLGSRSRDRRPRRRSGMDLRAQHARHARGRRRAWPRALARSRARRGAGGWVTLESRKGRGSTFTVFLRTQRPLTDARTDAGLGDGRSVAGDHWQAREARSHKKTPCWPAG